MCASNTSIVMMNTQFLAYLYVNIDELRGGGAAAVEGDLIGNAGRSLGAGRDQPQPIRLHVVRLRATGKPHSGQNSRRQSYADAADDSHVQVHCL